MVAAPWSRCLAGSGCRMFELIAVVVVAALTTSRAVLGALTITAVAWAERVPPVCRCRGPRPGHQYRLLVPHGSALLLHGSGERAGVAEHSQLRYDPSAHVALAHALVVRVGGAVHTL